MIIAFIVANLFLILLMLVARTRLIGFLGAYPAMSGEDSLAAFKEVARQNMYFALIYLIVGLPALGLAVMISREGWVGLLVALSFSLFTLLLGLHVKGLEERSKGLDCPDSAIDAEYKRVCEVWVKKALPDF